MNCGVGGELVGEGEGGWEGVVAPVEVDEGAEGGDVVGLEGRWLLLGGRVFSGLGRIGVDGVRI